MREETTANERFQHIFGRWKMIGEVNRAKKIANPIPARVILTTSPFMPQNPQRLRTRRPHVLQKTEMRYETKARAPLKGRLPGVFSHPW